jgi:hypothetical protein
MPQRGVGDEVPVDDRTGRDAAQRVEHVAQHRRAIERHGQGAAGGAIGKQRLPEIEAKETVGTVGVGLEPERAMAGDVSAGIGWDDFQNIGVAGVHLDQGRLGVGGDEPDEVVEQRAAVVVAGVGGEGQDLAWSP